MTEQDSTVALEADGQVDATQEGDAQEQAVAPAPEVSKDAQEPSLDELLSQFDQQSTESEPLSATKPVGEQSSEGEQEADDTHYKRYIEQQIQKEVDADLNNAVKTVKEAGDINMPNNYVRALLEEKAKTDKRILNAWRNRSVNPDAFEAVMKGIGRQLSKELGPPIDQNATESVDAVTSAVHSANQKTPDAERAPNVWSMSKKEWDAMKKKAAATK